MKTLTRYRDLPPARRRAVRRASFLLTTIQVGLAVLPFRHLLNVVYRYAAPRAANGPGSEKTSQFDTDLAVWAVEAAGRRLLSRNPCLPKALAILILFRRAGEDAELHLGVARDTEGPLQAHAWIESGGRVVIGGDVPLDRYTRLQGLESRQS